MSQNLWIRAKVNPAMEMAQWHNATEGPKHTESNIPDEYKEYLDVFEKKAAVTVSCGHLRYSVLYTHSRDTILCYWHLFFVATPHMVLNHLRYVQ